jgi:hypothetical protein
MCVNLEYLFGFNFIGIDLAGQLDEGKGLARTVADIKDANKRGALHFAAREGNTDICKYLLEELKLDVDTKDEDGMCLKKKKSGIRNLHCADAVFIV